MFRSLMALLVALAAQIGQSVPGVAAAAALLTQVFVSRAQAAPVSAPGGGRAMAAAAL